MALQEVKVDWRDFNDKLSRRIATSSKECFEVAAEQARGVIRNIVGITPPNHSLGNGKGLTNFSTAKAVGERKVEGDILSLYGTPGRAFEMIKEKSEAAAKAFWRIKKTNPEAAAVIVKRELNLNYSPFDDGVLHRRYRNKRGTIRRKSRPIFIVREDARERLDVYVSGRQYHVFFLASGWKPICESLGIPLPEMIARHNGPGIGTAEITDDHIRIYAANDVSYGWAVDLQGKVQLAVDMQSGNMQRQWEDFVATKFWSSMQ